MTVDRTKPRTTPPKHDTSRRRHPADFDLAGWQGHAGEVLDTWLREDFTWAGQPLALFLSDVSAVFDNDHWSLRDVTLAELPAACIIGYFYTYIGGNKHRSTVTLGRGVITLDGGGPMAPKASATSRTGSMADIRFDDSLDADQRRCVEQSITGLRERSRERIASRRAAQAELSKPAREANAKLVKYLEEHPDAALMFQAMRGRSLLAEDGQADAEPVLGQRTLSPVLMDVEVRENLKLFGTPFHYDWKWTDSDGGNFPRMSVSRETAVAKIDVGIKQVEGDSTWITAHAGVGVAIRTDKQVGAIGRAYRTTSEYGKVTQHGFDADATSEGGTELTVFEDGRFITSATDKRWRIRVAGDTPNTSHSSEGFAVGEVMDVTWVMRPGRTYTFNLGAWVYAEAHDGFDLLGLIGESTAVSSIDSRLLLLSLFT